MLAEVEKKLFTKAATAKCAIWGLGGVGKTQVLLELVYRTKAKHSNCLVIWIPATNKESLDQGYLNVANQLGISVPDNKTDVKSLVQAFLSSESRGQWLLVFDNADNIDISVSTPGSKQESGHLIDYLPRGRRGSIVFTTRDRKTAVKLAQQNIIEVPQMDETTAIQLLGKCLVNQDLNDADTKALLAQLTYLPLAMVQAAAYINENDITLADYLLLFEEQEEEVIDLLSEEFQDDWRYCDTKNPVATTWIISFKQIKHRDPLAAEHLSFIACMDPKDIPLSLLRPDPSRKKETDAIGLLTAYSFISKCSGDKTLDIHRLVCLAMRSWLRNENMLVQWTENAISRLADVFPTRDHRNRKSWGMYLTHARCVLESNLVEKYKPTRINLAIKFADCLYEDGRWKEAGDMLMQIMEIRKSILGQEHLDTLTIMGNLASTYRNQGRWKEAENFEARVTEIRKRVLGQEHPVTLISMGNLALTYNKQGRWKEAEDLEMQVLEIRKKVLGQDHVETLASMNHMASVYRNQGRWKEAQYLGVQVIKTSQRVLGQEHPNTLASISVLALIYQNQGRWKVAEDLEIQVIKIRKRVLGKEHPDTLSSMNNLASTYRNQRRWKEAEDLGLQVIETRKRVLGQEHPETLISMGNLAMIYQSQGRWKAAENLEIQVIKIKKRILGEEHPHTLASIGNLAPIYHSQGRWKEAEDLGVQVMEMRKRVLGQEHPETLASMNNLAVAFKCQGKYREALHLLSICLEVAKRKLGPDHPNTLACTRMYKEWAVDKRDT